MKKNFPTHIITHHSNGTSRDACASTKHQDVYIVDNWHKNRWRGFTSEVMKRPDNGEFWHVGYHLVTNMTTGETTQTRGFEEEGAHCLGKNTSSIGWLFIGNYSECSPDEVDPAVARSEFLKYAPGIMKEFNIPIENVIPHRHFASKDCHGSKLPDDYFQKFLLEDNSNVIVGELKEKVVKLEGIVQSLQRLIIMLINLLSKKRLAQRETNNAKPAS